MQAGTLSHPNQITDEAYKRMRKSWRETHGVDNQGGVAILEEGSKFDKISMSNEDAQYLETRQFQRIEICSIYRAPPHMVSRDLLTSQERQRGPYVESLVSGLERADIEERYRSYNIGIMSGILSPNECGPWKTAILGPAATSIWRRSIWPTPQVGCRKLRIRMILIAKRKRVRTSIPTLASKSIAVAVLALLGKAHVTKGVLAREQLRETFAPRFLELAKGLVLHEAGWLRQAMAEAAESGEVGRGLAVRMDELYRQLPAYIRNQFLGLMREYAEAVRSAALAEIDSDSEIAPEAMVKFVDEILVAFTARHIGSSQGQLAALITETVFEELPAAIEIRPAEWDATRPQKIAGREPVQQESAVSRWVWLAAGVTKLQWQRRGPKSCPFCKALHGKIVDISDPEVGFLH